MATVSRVAPRKGLKWASGLAVLLSACVGLAACGSSDSGSDDSIAIVVPPQIGGGGSGGGTDTGDGSGSTGPDNGGDPTPVPTPAELPLAGINIAGGEFGSVPGTLWQQYVYPQYDQLEYYKSQGFKVVRVPFRWERLQPKMFGELSSTDREELRRVVDEARSLGFIVVLDLHNYAERKNEPDYSTKYIVGSSEVPAEALADVWYRLAQDFRGDENVWLGLMNEPNGIPAEQWWPVLQEVVYDLRENGVDHTLLLPGTGWTGGWTWESLGNAAQAEKFDDPDNNSIFEVHQYLDHDGSGQSAACHPDSGKRLDAVIDWAQQHDVRLFVGEMGASGEAQCQIEYPAMLQAMDDSDGAVAAWTAWGGGAWWGGDYIFRLEPTAWPDTNQPTDHMKLLLDHIESRDE